MRAWRCRSLLVAGVTLAVVAGCGESSHDGENPGTGGSSAASGAASGSAGQATGVGGGAGKAGAPTGGSAGSGTGGTGGTGGVPAGGGGSSSGAGGSSAAAGAPDQATAEYRACAAYVEARCQRAAECGSYSVGFCMEDGLPLCPDFLFGPGSNNTPEHIRECAVDWQSASCTVLQTFIPVCVYAPGQYEDGHTCTSDSQCQSGACSGYSELCGTCLPVLVAGASCTAGASACPDGYDCIDDVCAPRRPTALPPGTACDIDYANCQSAYVCRASDTGEPTCQPRLEAGAPCAGNAAPECSLYHYCEPGTHVCTPSPPAGMPCGASGIGDCDAQSYCDRSVTPSVCVARVGLGETCFDDPDITDVHGNCEGALFCVCAAGEDCTDGSCMLRAAEGEACGNTTTFCVPGTECRDGTCAVSGLQGLYADACNR